MCASSASKLKLRGMAGTYREGLAAASTANTLHEFRLIRSAALGVSLHPESMHLRRLLVAAHVAVAAAALSIAAPAAGQQPDTASAAPAAAAQRQGTDTVAPELAVTPAADSTRVTEGGLMNVADQAMGKVNSAIGAFLFFDV